MKLIEVANNNSQVVATASNINLGNIDRRFNSNGIFNYSPLGIEINQTGYYEVSVNINTSANEVGNVEINLYANGTEIANAISTAVANAEVNLSINKIIRVYCNNSALITLTNNGVPTTINDVNLIIKKVS